MSYCVVFQYCVVLYFSIFMSLCNASCSPVSLSPMVDGAQKHKLNNCIIVWHALYYTVLCCVILYRHNCIAQYKYSAVSLLCLEHRVLMIWYLYRFVWYGVILH